MRLQIRNSVFETNSSSTHAMTIYKKDEWNEFKQGELIMKDGYLSDLSKKDNLYDEYKKYCQRYGYGEPTEAGFEDWIHDNTMDWDYFSDEYEILEEEVPDSEYVAVSIYGYDG